MVLEANGLFGRVIGQIGGGMSARSLPLLLQRVAQTFQAEIEMTDFDGVRQGDLVVRQLLRWRDLFASAATYESSPPCRFREFRQQMETLYTEGRIVETAEVLSLALGALAQAYGSMAGFVEASLGHAQFPAAQRVLREVPVDWLVKEGSRFEDIRRELSAALAQYNRRIELAPDMCACCRQQEIDAEMKRRQVPLEASVHLAGLTLLSAESRRQVKTGHSQGDAMRQHFYSPHMDSPHMDRPRMDSPRMDSPHNQGTQNHRPYNAEHHGVATLTTVYADIDHLQQSLKAHCQENSQDSLKAVVSAIKAIVDDVAFTGTSRSALMML